MNWTTAHMSNTVVSISIIWSLSCPHLHFLRPLHVTRRIFLPSSPPANIPRWILRGINLYFALVLRSVSVTLSPFDHLDVFLRYIRRLLWRVDVHMNMTTLTCVPILNFFSHVASDSSPSFPQHVHSLLYLFTLLFL